MSGVDTKPIRIQQRRTKGWRKPENTVSVARPSRWGNPYIVQRFAADEWGVGYKQGDFVIWVGAEDSREAAHRVVVEVFRELILHDERDLSDLRGNNLMCFCPLDQPCHAEVLLELANGDPS